MDQPFEAISLNVLKMPPNFICAKILQFSLQSSHVFCYYSWMSTLDIWPLASDYQIMYLQNSES